MLKANRADDTRTTDTLKRRALNARARTLKRRTVITRTVIARVLAAAAIAALAVNAFAITAAPGIALTAPPPPRITAPPITCAPDAWAARIAGSWVCVLFAAGTGTAETPLQVERVTGDGAHDPWCSDPLGVAPTGFGGAPEGMVPCHVDALGWWDGTNCYYRATDDPADDTMPGYQEHGAGGLVYRLHCFIDGTDGAGRFNTVESRVLPEPPDFEGGQPPVILTLWTDAVNQLVMTGPDIGTAPPAGQGSGLVRVPVWMWHNGTRDTGPAQAGPAGGQTVRAEATLTTIEWDPGDGTDPVVCDEWTAWQPGMDVRDPPCGHTYLRTSRDQPYGTFPITATAVWHLRWWINEEPDGELLLPAGAGTTLEIDEIQVLTK